MVRFLLLAVVSSDGFIARRAGDSPAAWASPEEQAEFFRTMETVSWSFLGRATHEAAPRADRKRVIFTRSVDAPRWSSANHLLYNPARASLDEVLSLARIEGAAAILGGTAIYDWFLERDRIDQADISVEPVAFGSGLPLFSRRLWRDALAARGLDSISDKSLNAKGTSLLRYQRRASAL